MKAVTGKVVAGTFSLAAFAVAMLSGLASDNPAAQILLHALVAMLVCYPVGMVVGLICERVVYSQIELYVKAHPTPDAEGGESRGAKAATKNEDDEEVLVV